MMEEIIKMLLEVQYKVEQMDDPTGPEELREDVGQGTLLHRRVH